MRLDASTVIDRTGNVLFRVTLTEDDGSVLTKTLAPEDYLRLIQNNCTVKTEYIHLGKLPKGYVDGAVAADDTFKVLLKVPASKRLLVHTSGHYEIPFPDLIFYFEVNKGTLKEKYVYALKGKILYHYPFGNVSTNGSICMGNISCKELSLATADEAIDSFFSGVTNNDYYYPKEKVTVSYSQQVLLDKLSRLEEFPARWLKKSGTTLESLEKRLRKEA